MNGTTSCPQSVDRALPLIPGYNFARTRVVADTLAIPQPKAVGEIRTIGARMSLSQLRLLVDSHVPSGAPNPPATDRRAIHVSGYDRKGQDFYATPPWVTQALLRQVPLRGPIWEPCCGDGAMATVLAADGHTVVASDIAERGFGTSGVDFMGCETVPAGCRAIVTNPPYGDSGSHGAQSESPVAMLKFLRHALTLTESVQGQLALLVRLQWVAGRRAADMMSAAPFSAMVILTKRIQWFDMGERTNTAQHHHAWVVFDHQHKKGRPPALLFAGNGDT
jgi:predicted RNA methylase